ncbi:spore coat protein [Gottfriedia solisilvae]|uniref:Uncharacterized protein n=1 Tax=Gottfriedia solisilvae TaxID=1516104 RepID=A0A8J3AFM4_9BACI|nr:spore coat protein [Gottfriedia solisilvae]GGI12353.1 hypothetical protein GCM10007380_12490 [Gottfriedia solisilvae]
MEQEGLPFYETMEAHEIINLKTIGLLKSKLMMEFFSVIQKQLVMQAVRLNI